MGSYECPRCGYATNLKADFKKHINKKYICSPINNDVSLDDLKEIMNKKKDINYTCISCNKGFSSKSGYYYHTIACLQEKKMDELKEKMDERLKNLEDSVINSQSLSGNNTINIQINNNNQRSILRPFGQENMEPLDTKTIGDLFLYLRIPELLQTLHCNPDYPENHNIRIKSVKRRAIEIFRGNKWDIVSHVNGLNEYILQGQKIFQNYYNKHKETIKDEMTPEELEEIKKKLKAIEDRDTGTLKNFYNDLALSIESLRTLQPSQQVKNIESITNYKDYDSDFSE